MSAQSGLSSLVECNNLNALGVHISIRRTSRRHLVPNSEKNDRRTTPTSLASREQGERSVTEIKRKRAHWSDRDNEIQWERERARIERIQWKRKGSSDHNSRRLSSSDTLFRSLASAFFLACGRDTIPILPRSKQYQAENTNLCNTQRNDKHTDTSYRKRN